MQTLASNALDSTALDVAAYLARVGYSGPLDATRETLQQLHLAHATHIPFENVAVLMGQPMPLDVKSLQAKLVHGRRGGYCFEQNILFWAVLQAAGFQVRPLAARVRYKTQRVLPRTHMLLLVEGLGMPVIADVGFGGEGPLLPLDLAADTPERQLSWQYRLLYSASGWTLQTLDAGAWIDLYTFGLEHQEIADLEMAHYYTATHPNSRFRQTLAVQCVRDGHRYGLRNRELTIDDGMAKTVRVLADHADVLVTLARDFGLEIPADTAFKYDMPF